MTFSLQRCLILALASCLPAYSAVGNETKPPIARGRLATTWDEAYSRMKPWRGTPAMGASSRANDIKGKVVCGYQGWFAAEGDGTGLGWVHYGDKVFKPGAATVDLWPDMTEMDPDEKFPTPFQFADGTTATVFSSYHPKTVQRHFRWMADYGIDGAFLQRFGSDMKKPATYDFCNAILDNVRNAANATGRVWVVMYDLSGLNSEEIRTVIMEDWKRLVDRAEIRKDPAYLHVDGKPLVALWGVGFNEGRRYSLKDCEALVDFLKDDPRYGGNNIMLGVPFAWRTGERDALDDPLLHSLIKKAAVVSPWSVTRYNSAAAFKSGLSKYQKPDMEWCRENGVAYLPVIFPGFTWINLMKTRDRDGNPHTISRDKGKFLWTQGSELIQSGAEMLYVAMFDEIDEGTSIMKTSSQSPVGESRFQTEEGVAPDQYLWLTGQLGALLRKERSYTEQPPER